MNNFFFKKRLLLLKGYTRFFEVDNISYLDNNESPLDEANENSPFITQWVVSAGDSVTLPLSENPICVYSCTVDWGDNSISSITAYNDANRVHTYTNAGTYNISITGTCTGWSFSDVDSNRLLVTKIINFGGGKNFDGFNYLYYAFRNCTNLVDVGSSSIKEYGETIIIDYLFYGCINLKKVYHEIFKKLISISSISYLFQASGISEIPEDLFKYNTLITVFNNNFSFCQGLTSIPENLFKYNTAVINFYWNFAGCTSLTSIPENLFKYNTKAINMDTCFGNCTSLTSIPENLFKYNTAIQSFKQSFQSCIGLTIIPSGLFYTNTEVVRFDNTFYNCSHLTSIPEELFKNNTKVQLFYECFRDCPKLTLNKYIFYSSGEESTKFLNKTVNFTNCFYRTSFTGVQGIAPELWLCDFGTGTATKTDCFAGAGNSVTSLSNYADIPTEWV